MTTVLKQKKKVSKRLQTLLDSVSQQVLKLENTVKKVYKIGREDGFTDMEIGDMLRAAMKKGGYTDRTIRNHLPESAKHIEFANKRAEKSSASKHGTKAKAVTKQKVQNKEHTVDYQLEPEEKDFDELLAWENDLPGFPPELLLRYTIQLIKVSKEQIRILKAKEKEGPV